MWPQLQTLHACFNNVQTIDNISTSLQNLKLLNLESNPIASWNEVVKLDSLKR